MRRRKGKRQIGPVRLIFFIGSLILLGYHILSTPGCREKLHLGGSSSGIARWFGSWFGRGGEKEDKRIVSAITSKDLEVFASSFSNREVRTVTGPPELPVAPDPNGRRKPGKDRKFNDSLWPVRVKTTFQNAANEWTAYIETEHCRRGEILYSVKPDRCQYEIYYVGNGYVWLQAFNDKDYPLQILEPVVSLPKIKRIQLKKKGKDWVPDKVRFAGGESRAEDEMFYIGQDRTIEYKIAKIWSRGVCFELRKGDAAPLYLTCMLTLR